MRLSRVEKRKQMTRTGLVPLIPFPTALNPLCRCRASPGGLFLRACPGLTLG